MIHYLYIKDQIECFFLGHIIRMGSRPNYEPDWCARCFCECPQEKTTLPFMLNDYYGWLFEHSRLFIKLEDWLYQHKLKLPTWWEY